MPAITINDMLKLFGIEAHKMLDTGDWICVLPDGRIVVTSQDRMEKLACAFADLLFEERELPAPPVPAQTTKKEEK